MKFSERQGYVKPQDVIQTDWMSDALRNSLWNVLHVGFFDVSGLYSSTRNGTGRIQGFSVSLWSNHFKRPIDERSSHETDILKTIRHHFFSVEWFHVYDFLEWVLNFQLDYSATGSNSGPKRERNTRKGGWLDSVSSPECSRPLLGIEIAPLNDALSHSDFPGFAHT